MDRPFDRRLVVALGLVVALVLVNAVVAYRNTRQLQDDAHSVAQTYQVLNALDGLLSTMKDAETGQRGFLITGDERYLAPYDDALAGLNGKVEELRRLTADDNHQQARIPRLQELLQAKVDELAGTIALRKGTGLEAAQHEVMSHIGKNRMDAIRALAAEMQQDEQGLLQQRQAAGDRAYLAALISGVLAALLALAAVVGFIWLLRRHLEARLQASAVLYEQREWFRATLASIGDAVIVTDTDGRVTFLNAAAQALTGRTEDESNGQLLEAVFTIVNEETRKTVENPALRVLKEGGVVGLANHTILISRTGIEIPIEDSAAPIRDQKGRIAGVVLVFRDISARKLQEKERERQVVELAEAEERIRSVVNTVIDGIITIDQRGLVQSFNPAAEKLFAYKAEEIVGQNVKMLMPEPYCGEHDGYIANYLRTGQAKIIGIGREVDGRRKDGSTFPMELAVSEFRLGQRRYFTGVVHDITERKRTEKQMSGLLIELKEADRRKDEFLAMLAHELRGPLAPLCHTVEVIKRADGGGALIQQARGTMERQLGQMVRLVDDLRDVSRITSNKLELRKEHIELAPVVYHAVETCRPLAESLKHEVTVTLPPESIYLDGDPVRLAQVFSNLLINACKYTEPGGHIGLTAELRGSDVVVSVQDNGIGIPADKLPQVFDMFMQVNRTSEPSQSGLGIGLTLVKRLAELHDGSVEASSDGPGRGSKFVVHLPILRGEPKRSSERTPSAAATPRRILVVDDNKDSATSLAALLKVTGNETYSVHDGLEAVEAAARFRPDVVLLDIGLPRLNGYDAARRIREQPWGRNILLVALSGWGQHEDRLRSKDAGFDHHMVKPVDYAALAKLLASLPLRRKAS